MDRNADIAHVGRQSRLCNGDAVLHLHLGDVEIGTDIEAHRNCEAAVAGRIRRQVNHVLDAIDLLLDRRNHSGGHDVGAGARILAGNGDGRRRDIRILRDRQTGEGHSTDDHEHNRDHRRENWPVDEEVRNAHGLVSPRYFAGCGAAAAPPGAAAGLAPSSSGRTFEPGRACIRPLTTIRSSGPIPSLMTRRLSDVSWPVVTYF